MDQEKILKELKTKIHEALEALNKRYKTDSGRDTVQHAKGYLSGLIIARTIIEKHALNTQEEFSLS
jgi:hypothetical protein